MASFPTSLDDGTSLPNPSGSNTQNNPDHAAQHSTANDAIKAIEAKVGIGASTPVVNRLLYGTGTGTTAWTQLTSSQLAGTLTDETGTGSAVFATTPTLVTPKVDTINENTPANGVTIDGLNIKDGALNTNNSVVTANITDASVTPSKLATGGQVGIVATSETTTSTSYADLATTTDTVTVTVGSNKLVILSISATLSNNTSAAGTFVSFASSGANTSSASDGQSLSFTPSSGTATLSGSWCRLVSFANAGSTTIKMKYRVTAGIGTFSGRYISAVPL